MREQHENTAHLLVPGDDKVKRKSVSRYSTWKQRYRWLGRLNPRRPWPWRCWALYVPSHLHVHSVAFTSTGFLLKKKKAFRIWAALLCLQGTSVGSLSYVNAFCLWVGTAWWSGTNLDMQADKSSPDKQPMQMQAISARKGVLWSIGLQCHALYYLFSYSVIFDMHCLSALHKQFFIMLRMLLGWLNLLTDASKLLKTT